MDYKWVFTFLFFSIFGCAISTNITLHGYDLCGALAPWDNRKPDQLIPIKCSVDHSEEPSTKCFHFQAPIHTDWTLNYPFDGDLRTDFITQMGHLLRYCYVLREYRVEVNATVTACTSLNRSQLHGIIIISPEGEEDEGLSALILSIFLVMLSSAVLTVSYKKYKDGKGRLDAAMGFKRMVKELQRSSDRNMVTAKKVEEEQRQMIAKILLGYMQRFLDNTADSINQ